MKPEIAPKMRPIIFSSPMVRSLIAGRKTQTRRLADIDLPQSDAEIVMRGDSGCSVHIPGVGYGSILDCPYGGPGDRLYVREGIRCEQLGPDGLVPEGSPALATYVADKAPVPFLDRWPWKHRQLSPIHMPRVLHRLEIVLLEVRVEALQSISYDDAIAEGAFRGNEERNRAHWTMDDRATGPAQCLGSPQMAFANLYNVLHGGPNWNLKPGPSPFDRNPFVWVLRFRVELNPELKADDGTEENLTPRELYGAPGATP